MYLGNLGDCFRFCAIGHTSASSFTVLFFLLVSCVCEVAPSCCSAPRAGAGEEGRVAGARRALPLTALSPPQRRLSSWAGPSGLPVVSLLLCPPN